MKFSEGIRDSNSQRCSSCGVLALRQAVRAQGASTLLAQS